MDVNVRHIAPGAASPRAAVSPDAATRSAGRVLAGTQDEQPWVGGAPVWASESA